MAAPTYSTGTNLLNGVSLAPGKNAACLFDLSTVIQGLVWVLMETGSSVTSMTGVTFALRRVIGAKATGNTTLSSGVSSGATSITVGSATNIVKGRMIALIAATTGVGEIVTVSGVSGTTITISATENAYALNDLVFLVEDIASGGSIVPSTSGTWAANTPYDTTLYPPIGVWILHVSGDSAQTTTITALADEVAAIQ
jgi:hypothetical protein